MQDYLQVFFTTYIILGTLGNIILFESLLDSYRVISKKERETIIKKAYLIAYLVWIPIFLFGSLILDVFGITVDGFRIAGGLFLLILSLDILKDNIPKSVSIIDKKEIINSIVATPMAVPLITGPGTITTTILFTSTSRSLDLFVVMTLAYLTSFLTVYVGEELIRKFGKLTIIVLNRLSGLILLSIAIEFILKGILQYV